MNDSKKLSVGVAVITLNAERHLPFCLPPLIRSTLCPRVLVLDSTSNDNTVKLSEKLGAETLVIPRHEFNHGLTRERARRHLNTDIVVFLTQDAYTVNEGMLEKLVEPLQQKLASVSYARQMPHRGADIFEAFPREFNYPIASQMRGIDDVAAHGVYTFFCSNSCAAYLNSALDEIGGFKPILFGEDTLAVAELLHKGHKIAYVAEAEVRHSHRYTLVQEFRRNFDIGLSRKELQPWIACAGLDEKRGARYIKELTQRLLRDNKTLLPYAYLQSVFKLLGYRLGRASTKAPLWFKRAVSSQKYYWDNFGKENSSK